MEGPGVLLCPGAGCGGAEAALRLEASQLLLGPPRLRPLWAAVGAPWGVTGNSSSALPAWGESERRLPKQFSAKSLGVCVKDKIVCPMGKYS